MIIPKEQSRGVLREQSGSVLQGDSRADRDRTVAWFFVLTQINQLKLVITVITINNGAWFLCVIVLFPVLSTSWAVDKTVGKIREKAGINCGRKMPQRLTTRVIAGLCTGGALRTVHEAWPVVDGAVEETGTSHPECPRARNCSRLPFCIPALISLNYSQIIINNIQQRESVINKNIRPLLIVILFYYKNIIDSAVSELSVLQ